MFANLYKQIDMQQKNVQNILKKIAKTYFCQYLSIRFIRFDISKKA
jgi:hypothetical protein